MMEFTAEMIAGFLGGDIVGDKTVKVHTVSSIEEGKAGSMAYLVNPKYEPFLYTTEASIVLVDRSFTPQREVKPTLVKVDDAGAAVLRLLEMYNAARPQKKGVSERASISPEASLGEGCYVGDFAVIEAGARIGDGCRIYPQVYVGDGVEIGQGTTLYPGVKIYEGCRIGSRCILHAGAVIGADGFRFAPNAEGGFDKIPQLGNVIIEDDVEIGANTCIDRAKTDSTIIRRGVKLDNLIQVGHNVQIGEHTVSSAQMGIAGSSKIGRNCFPRGAGRHRGPRHHRRPREDRLAERRRQERARRRSPHGHAGAAGHQVPPRERRLPQPPRVAAAALRAGKGGQPTDRKISMKRTLAFAASLLLLGACSSDGYTIRGKIAGLDNPYVYLLRYTGEVEVIDSAKVTKGDFCLQRQGRTARGGLPEHRQATALRPFLPGKRPYQRRRRTLRTGRHRRTGHAVERHPAGVRRKDRRPGRGVRQGRQRHAARQPAQGVLQADVRRRGDEPRQYLRRDHVPEQRLRLPFARGGDGADRALPPPSGSSAAN